ncbi:hypothetical protein CN907_09540 [Bacillus anthracis]|nr:hypothetical protein CN907_09540 [Bacillus anthracis]
MAIISGYINKIRNAIFGKEVRGLLADGLEAVNKETEAATTLSNQTKTRQENLEKRWDLVVSETTDGAEVIEMRVDTEGVAHGSAKGRIDSDYQKNATKIMNLEEKTNDKFVETERDISALTDINPDISYIGTDIEKIQAAINDCLKSNGAKKLVLTRIFDLTGGTIKINRGDIRYPAYISGGGFEKYDDGFMFSSDLPNSSDVYFTNVSFKSIAGIGTRIFNFDVLIRVHTTNCHFKNVDCIGYCSDFDKYVQSYLSIGDTVHGGNGYAYDFSGVYDTIFSKLTLEQRDSGIRIRSIGQHGTTYGLTIEKSVLEGLSGIAIYLNTSLNTNIEDNYFEANQLGNIVFSDTAYVKGVSIKNNKLYGSHNSVFKYLVKWGKTIHSAISEGNISTYKGIHNASLVETGYIFSKNDYGSVDYLDLNSKRISYQATEKFEMYNDNVKGTKSFMGVFNRLTSNLNGIVIPPSTRTTVAVPFKEPIRNDDLISVQLHSSNKDITVMNYYKSGNNVVVNLKNEETINLNLDLTVCVMKGYFTITG